MAHKVTNFDGFEGGDPTVASQPGTAFLEGGVTCDSTTKRTGLYSLKVDTTGGTGRHGLVLPVEYGTNGQLVNQGYDYLFIDGWIRFEQFPSATMRILAFRNTIGAPGAGQTIYYVAVHSDGTLDLNGNQAVSPTVLSLNTFYRIGIKCHNGTDVEELRINGATEVSRTDALSAGTRTVYLGKFLAAAGTGYIAYYDDFKIEASNTEADIDWPQDAVVKMMNPDSVASFDEWTTVVPSGSANWQVTDEVPPDDETTYVESPTTVGERTHVGFETISNAGIRAESVIAAKVHAMVEAASAGSASNTYLAVKSGSTTDDGAASSISWGVGTANADYYVLARIYRTDPNTSATWTEAALNALEMGLVDNDALHPLRATQFGVQVLYEVAVGLEFLGMAVVAATLAVVAVSGNPQTGMVVAS